MKRVKILSDLDKQNMKKRGTQFAKTVKLRESTYNLLMAMKKNDSKMKSLDDVVVGLMQIAALMKDE